MKDFVTNSRYKLPFDVHPLAREVLEELRPRHGEPPSADISISSNDLQEAYRKWREKTHTSPEGTHLGHYKVWLRDYGSTSKEEKTDSGQARPLTRDEYFGIQATKINLALVLGHPLKRWIKVLMIFIPKDEEEVSLIMRLRAIDSFDAEINLLRRILVSHRTMDQAEAGNLITYHQYGGR